MKTVFILVDSLCRRCLPMYNSKSDVIVPNMTRLAKRAAVFENHWTGSAPCMPARRDMLTGRLNFLERPWGGIEPFDHVLPAILKTKNVYTRMETDHMHYASKGGENYWSSFTSRRLHRGAEVDTLYWRPDKTGIPHTEKPDGYVGNYLASYNDTMKVFGKKEESYSTPRTFTGAAEWLEENHSADNFLLWVEGFDPHEPFDVPDEYLELYGSAEYDGLDPFWPEYSATAQYTDKQQERFRQRYKALITMTDKYIGKLLDVLDRYSMWDDTMVIFTTDHGFMLGEHGYWAKNYMPDYNEVYHIPLMISAPGVEPCRKKALTQNIDILPTVMDFFSVDRGVLRNPIHGKSLMPLLKNEADSVRNAVLFGTFGKTAGVTDGKYVYNRKAVDTTKNEPLNIYAGTMSLMNDYIGYDSMSDEAVKSIGFGKLKWTDFPVYKVPASSVKWSNMSLSFENINNLVTVNTLYDIVNDYEQLHPVDDAEKEQYYIGLLRELMLEHDSPDEQLVRLGI